MSRRLGSSINSHYFTTDPVSIRDTGLRQTGSKYFTKGHENSPKPQQDSESLNSLLPLNNTQSSDNSSSNFSQPNFSQFSDREPLIAPPPFNNSFPSELSTFGNVTSTISANAVNKMASSNPASLPSLPRLPSSSGPDVFTIDGPDGSLQVDRTLLRETLQLLKNDSQTPVNQLTSEKTELFKSVLEALRMLYNNQSAYDIVLGDIRQEFSQVVTIKPGTVAAFFVGCFTDDKFTGPVGCSPNCVASVFPTSGTTGYAHCDDLVLIYNDGIFSSLNEKRSTHAYIYVGDVHFSGFTSVNITQLKDAGVENVSIVFGNTDGTFREVTSMLTLDQLPKHAEVKVDGAAATTTSTTSTTSTSMNTTGAIIVLVLIFVAIAVLLYFIYLDNSR